MIDVLILVLLIVALAIGGGLWARDRLWHNDIKKRFVVTLKDKEGEFAGLLVEESWRRLVFENCVTVPNQVIETPQAIPGRMHVDRVNIVYRQELSNDPV